MSKVRGTPGSILRPFGKIGNFGLFNADRAGGKIIYGYYNGSHAYRQRIHIKTASSKFLDFEFSNGANIDRAGGKIK